MAKFLIDEYSDESMQRLGRRHMQMNELGFYTSAGAPKFLRDLDEMQKNILTSRQPRQKKILI